MLFSLKITVYYISRNRRINSRISKSKVETFPKFHLKDFGFSNRRIKIFNCLKHLACIQGDKPNIIMKFKINPN